MIPARSGSKRLPGKNLRSLNGQPLISYSITAGLNSVHITHTFVSTDSEEILALATKQGCDRLGLRPAHLSADLTSSLDVLQFEVSRLEALLVEFEYIVLLQPTSPLRNAADVDRAITAFLKSGADTLTSGYKTPMANRDQWVIDGEWLLPAQDAEAEIYFKENGAIYILSKELLKRRIFYGAKTMKFDFPEERSVDIDTLSDFEKAQAYLTRQATSRGSSSVP